MNPCANPMIYSGDVHIQAIDVWAFTIDCTDCNFISAVCGIEFDPSAERFETAIARIRGSPRPGGL